MKRLFIASCLTVSLIVVSIASVVLGQNATDQSFALVQQIGRIRPQSVKYNPPFDQFIVVDLQGRLLLINAQDYTIQYVLYDRGTFNAFEFSHDGQWVALAIDQRIELWNTQTGELTETLEPDGALSVTGPIQFAPDDELLKFDTLIRAPAATRRSENDTDILPWLWDLPAARRERRAKLPGAVRAMAFFDYRNGFVLGANDRVLAALPQRLLLIDPLQGGSPIITEIPSDRFEQDPITVWQSLRDEQLYVRPINQNNIVQINTLEGTTISLPLGRSLDYNTIPGFNTLQLSDQARIIGEPNSNAANSFLRMLLGSQYQQNWGYHSLTVMLLDILEPVTISADQMGLLIYIFDEETGRGTIDLVRPTEVSRMVLHPDGVHFMVRRSSGEQPIEVYNLDTGILEASYFPTERDQDGNHTLAYNHDGSVIISDYQRFDAITGEVLYEDPHYTRSFERYAFTDDGTGLVTITGTEWHLWDIETGALVRQERFILQGSEITASPDLHRFLARLDTSRSSGIGIEVLDIGTGERNQLYFDRLAGSDIIDIIPSPDWINFLIIYSPNQFDQHYPGNSIAIYNLYEGELLFLAGDDLPPPDNRSYGWRGNETVYIRANDYGNTSQPTRIYGINYHASGLPQCLVDRFPNDWENWTPLWDRFTQTLRTDTLNQLAVTVCDIKFDTVEAVHNVFFPSPTPTAPPVTATPSFIAGVPVCLTSRFPGEAAQYAQIWREMTEGLNADEIAEMEELVCEGLSERVGAAGAGGSTTDTTQVVMTIDVKTGIRTLQTELPQANDRNPSRPDRDTPLLEIVLNEFQKTENYYPENARISPDGRYLAERTFSGHINIYRLLTPYETLLANARATEAAIDASAGTEAPRIQIRPTDTPAFANILGEARPTFTPTVSPTAPPRPEDFAELAMRDEIIELCPADTLYDISNPPPDYNASGRIVFSMANSTERWILEPATGHRYPDESVPVCNVNTNCIYSPDASWILARGDDISVSRPDGTNKQVLFREQERSAWPDNIYWINPNTLEYQYTGYLEDKSGQRTLYQKIVLGASEQPEPSLFPDPISINELSTEIVSQQPDGGSLVVARTSFKTGSGFGSRYYIYDRATGETAYFAQIADNAMTFTWHPRGTALYYRYPDSSELYIYNPATRTHQIFGTAIPGGIWSNDTRYLVSWFTLDDDARAEHIENDIPLPTLRIWDHETGQTRRYCVPQTNEQALNVTLYWSPDNKYVAFQTILPKDDPQFARPRTLVLDVESGTVTELSFDVGEILIWLPDTWQDNAMEAAR